MYVPKLKFSRWMKWGNRNNFVRKDYPGIYVIAITRKNLDGKKVKYKDVSYIGMTNAISGLYGRWNQFDHSINGKGGHSGGNRINKELGNYNRWKKKRRVYVAAFSLKCNADKKIRNVDDLIIMGKVAYLEYEALSKYRKRMGDEPEYNTK